MCVVIFLPRDDVKVAVLRLQVVPEDLPSQLDAPPLAGRAVGGASHLDGPDLGGLQCEGVAIVAEQLQRAEGATCERGERYNPNSALCCGPHCFTWWQMSAVSSMRSSLTAMCRLPVTYFPRLPKSLISLIKASYKLYRRPRHLFQSSA